MTALEYIINGLEAELALQRELGVRFIECDRSLLLPVAEAAKPSVSEHAPKFQEQVRPQAPSVNPLRPPAEKAARPATSANVYDFVFLHDKPLSEKGALIISKICRALNRDLTTAPLFAEGELPQAKVYVALGALAMRKWFPGMNSVPGAWEKGPGGIDVLVTYSPEYLVRFELSPAIETIKRNMWHSLKSIVQRVAQ